MSHRAQTWLPWLKGPRGGKNMSTSNFHLSNVAGNWSKRAENVLFCEILLGSTMGLLTYFGQVHLGFSLCGRMCRSFCRSAAAPEIIRAEAFFSTSIKRFLSSLEPGSRRFHIFVLFFVCVFRIKIEEEYAKNLSKLSQSPLALQEEG